MVKTWIDLETNLDLATISAVGWNLLGLRVEKLDISLSSLNRKPRAGWVKVHFWKPYAIEIAEARNVMSIACRAIEVAQGMP
jgi:hypothetical protein